MWCSKCGQNYEPTTGGHICPNPFASPVIPLQEMGAPVSQSVPIPFAPININLEGMGNLTVAINKLTGLVERAGGTERLVTLLERLCSTLERISSSIERLTSAMDRR